MAYLIGLILDKISNTGGNTLMGLNTPDRKNWGNIIKGNTWFADLCSDKLDKTKIPNAPPSKHTTSIKGIKVMNWDRLKGICRIIPNINMPINWVSETRLSPMIFPIIMEYREIGEMNISWEKSFCLSSIKEITPEAVEEKRVWPITPKKVKVKKSNPTFCDKLACKAPPKTPMKINGKIKLMKIRGLSRSSFKKSL